MVKMWGSKKTAVPCLPAGLTAIRIKRGWVRDDNVTDKAIKVRDNLSHS